MYQKVSGLTIAAKDSSSLPPIPVFTNLKKAMSFHLSTGLLNTKMHGLSPVNSLSSLSSSKDRSF